jgi:hypothetical protein
MNHRYGKLRGPAPGRENTVDAHSRDREDSMSIGPLSVKTLHELTAAFRYFVIEKGVMAAAGPWTDRR